MYFPGKGLCGRLEAVEGVLQLDIAKGFHERLIPDIAEMGPDHLAERAVAGFYAVAAVQDQHTFHHAGECRIDLALLFICRPDPALELLDEIIDISGKL